MIFGRILEINQFMKTLRILLLLASLTLWGSCGQRRVSDDKPEIAAPGVGMAPDSANQKLDSTITAQDTTNRRH